MAENDTQLSTVQRRAITALLASRTVREAAQSAKVSERTMYRWLGLRAFRDALVLAENDILDQATRRLLSLQSQVVDTLVSILLNVEMPANVRVRAAQVLSEYSLRLLEYRNFAVRISALEEKVHEQSK